MTDSDEPSLAPGRVWVVIAAAVVGVGAFVYFLNARKVVPVFPDETAYVTQSYFYDLLVSGQRDDWAWVEYHAYDLPPLPKYLIGMAIEAAGFRPPDRLLAGLWFRNITQQLVPTTMIHAGRWPIVVMGALGCVAVFCLGGALGAWRVGLVAAILLAANPLYGLLARRAMADVPAECLLVASLAVALVAWRRTLEATTMLSTGALTWTGAGVLVGLAVLAKLNGLLAALVIAAWVVLGLLQFRLPLGRRLWVVAGTLVAAMSAFVTFVMLNPMVTARPTGPPPPALLFPLPPDQGMVGRLSAMIAHRAEVSQRAQKQFPHNALTTLPAKLAAVATQGFGRFGELGPRDHDSTVPYARYDLRRDWGAIVWLPLVLVGAVCVASRGVRQARQGRAPTFLAIGVAALVTVGVVAAFLPLAWDRYYLSIQPVACLLAAVALVTGFDALRQRMRPSGQARP